MSIKARLDSLEKMWTKFHDNNDTMVTEKNQKAENYYFKLAFFSQAEEKCFASKPYLNGYLDHF